MSKPSGRLSLLGLAALASPGVPLAVLGSPLQIYIPPYYAGHLGLGLVQVGFVFSLMRLWDLAATPLIGWLCDRQVGRWGRRRFWMAVATPLVAAATAAIFMPPRAAGLIYLSIVVFALYAAFDLFNLAYSAWSAEVSADYHERSRIQTARQATQVVGLLLILSLPSLAGAWRPADPEATRMALMGAFLVALLPLAAVWTLARTPEPAVVLTSVRPAPLAESLRLLARNRALRIVLSITLLEGVGFGVINSMLVFLIEDVWRLGDATNLVLLAYVVSGLAFLAPILWISRRLGKHRTAFCTTLTTMLSLPIVFLVPPNALGFALAAVALTGVTQVGVQALYASMMSDIADQDLVESGQPRAGQLFSLWTMTGKVGGALAIGAGYWVLHAAGFHPGGHNDPATLAGFKLAFLGPPILIEAAVAALLWRYPLSEARQRQHREILLARAAG